MTTTSDADGCPDCGVLPSRPHEEGCDVARCLWTGLQRLGCEWFGLDPILTEHDCGEDTWTGDWPGQADAAALGFWCIWDGPGPENGWDYHGRGWVRVEAGHPGAMPDLNRLIIEARWDRRLRRWLGVENLTVRVGSCDKNLRRG